MHLRTQRHVGSIFVLAMSLSLLACVESGASSGTGDDGSTTTAASTTGVTGSGGGDSGGTTTGGPTTTAGSGGALRSGATLTPTFLTIAKAFFLTAASFGALSLFGYTTKSNLQPIGVFMTFALFGLIGVGLISLLFPPSGMMEILIQVGVLGVSGVLVAVDTQNLKQNYFAFEGDARSLAVMTNWGALNFFILFYNIFTMLMSLLSRD